MIKVPKEFIIEKIKEKSHLSDDEIRRKVKEKLDQLSGLISEEGALHIIANELGVKVLEANQNLQVKNVFPGMRNVELVGKVTRVFEVRQFSNPQRTGKVGSFLVGDPTGIVRIVAWGNHADSLQKINEGDTVKIKSGYTKENNNRVEVHLNDNSHLIINPEGESVGEVKAQKKALRKKISEISVQDQNVEILGTIVQAFDPRFFEICPYCTKRIKQQEGAFVCESHGAISQPDYSYVMNAIIDDGSQTIRAIFFKNQLQHLLNLTHDEILSKRGESFEELKTDVLGKIIKVLGRVANNEMFSRLEIVAQIVDPNPSPDEEIKRIGEPKIASNPQEIPSAKNYEKVPVKEESQKKPFEEKSSEEAISIDDIESFSDDDDIYE